MKYTDSQYFSQKSLKLMNFDRVTPLDFFRFDSFHTNLAFASIFALLRIKCGRNFLPFQAINFIPLCWESMPHLRQRFSREVQRGLANTPHDCINMCGARFTVDFLRHYAPTLFNIPNIVQFRGKIIWMLAPKSMQCRGMMRKVGLHILLVRIGAVRPRKVLLEYQPRV